MAGSFIDIVSDVNESGLYSKKLAIVVSSAREGEVRSEYWDRQSWVVTGASGTGILVSPTATTRFPSDPDLRTVSLGTLHDFRWA